MFRFIEEMFLLDYFIYDAAVGAFCRADKIFDCLAGCYMISPDRQKDLFSLATAAQVKNIVSINDYKRYLRLRQYMQSAKASERCLSDEDNVIVIKGKALEIAATCKIIAGRDTTRASMYTQIVNKAHSGFVTALRIYGVLQCEGIFFEKNCSRGISNLRKAARWNNIESTLALMHYDFAHGHIYKKMFVALAVGTPYESAIKLVPNISNIKAPGRESIPALLAKLIDNGKVSPDSYQPAYDNILYSSIISFKDKEKLLNFENKQSIPAYGDMPHNLAMRSINYDTSAISQLSLNRPEERDSIIRYAKNSDIRNVDSFRPICLCSDSMVMRRYYAAAISKLFPDSHIANISVEDMRPHDFEATTNNIFLRSCDDAKSNVFVISVVGDIDEAAQKAIVDFLQGDKRRRIYLTGPGIEVDLSAVLPICLCDKSNARILARYCERVDIANPDHKEFRTLITELVAEKGKRYGIDTVTIHDAVIEKLRSVTIDAADEVLDVAIPANRNGISAIMLTEKNTIKYISNRGISRGYGYGGCKDDNK